MKKILVVSNSFGEDANRYVYGIARGQKPARDDVKIVTLYIGGCSLARHYRNMLSGEKVYDYIIDGIYSGLKVSLTEALFADEWDVVVTQQNSPNAGSYETYEPYIGELTAYFRKCAPKAKLYLQMTWSYPEGGASFKMTPFSGRADMIPAVIECYERVKKEQGYDGIIPSMLAMNKLYDIVGDKAYRDGHHANFGTGRYLLGLVWYMTLFGKDVVGNSYRDFDEPVSEDEVILMQKLAKEAAVEYGLIVEDNI